MTCFFFLNKVDTYRMSPNLTLPLSFLTILHLTLPPSLFYLSLFISFYLSATLPPLPLNCLPSLFTLSFFSFLFILFLQPLHYPPPLPRIMHSILLPSLTLSPHPIPLTNSSLSISSHLPTLSLSGHRASPSSPKQSRYKRFSTSSGEENRSICSILIHWIAQST